LQWDEDVRVGWMARRAEKKRREKRAAELSDVTARKRNQS